jgi:hypothetical protein
LGPADDDFNKIGQNWLSHPNAWQLGDFTADGNVDTNDLEELAGVNPVCRCAGKCSRTVRDGVFLCGCCSYRFDAIKNLSKNLATGRCAHPTYEVFG